MIQVGCIIGRFQPFHVGHNLLIETSLKENISTFVFIGSVNKIDDQNPYSFNLRKTIISNNYNNPNISILGLPDFETDELWIEHILKSLPSEIKTLVLYCGDMKSDSAIISIKKFRNILPFTLRIQEIPRSIIPVSATQVRGAIKDNNLYFLRKNLSKITLDLIKDRG